MTITPQRALLTTVSIVVSLFLSFFLLFTFGYLGQIRAYPDPQNLSTLKLLAINSTLFITMTCALYPLIREFLNLQLRKNMILFSALVVSFLFSNFLMMIPDGKGHAVGFSYILVGDYLRDVHGISIYYMDWAGWAITITLYLTSIFSTLLFIGLKRSMPFLFADKK